MALMCPVCACEMESTRVGISDAIEIDRCPSCAGSWFDAGELDSLDDSVWSSVEALAFNPQAEPPRVVPCPRCDHVMTPITPAEFPELVLDRCPTCAGFWLDAGELEQVQELSMIADSERLENTRILERPDDWTWLRWNLYRLSSTLGGWNP